jgi:hypothetical protein
MDKESQEQEDVVKFVFEKSPDYRIIAANGVWGGVTPQGHLKLDLFVDSIITPESITHNILKDGRLGDEIAREPSGKIVTRELQIGVVLPVNIAETIGKWILARVQEAKSASGGS